MPVKHAITQDNKRMINLNYFQELEMSMLVFIASVKCGREFQILAPRIENDLFVIIYSE